MRYYVHSKTVITEKSPISHMRFKAAQMPSNMHLPQKNAIAYSTISSSAKTRFSQLPLPVCCSKPRNYAHLPDVLGDEKLRTVLFDHLEQTFPKNVATFQDSLAEQTIKSLESFLSQFTASSFAEEHQEHQRVFFKINRASAGLKSIVFSPPPSPVKERGELGLNRRRRMSQQEVKRARVKQTGIDDTPFQILGIHPPVSLQQYDATIESVMATLKRILRVSISSG